MFEIGCVDETRYNVRNAAENGKSIKIRKIYHAISVQSRLSCDWEVLPAVRTVCVMTTGMRTCPPIVPVRLMLYRVRDRVRRPKVKTKQLTGYLGRISIEY